MRAEIRTGVAACMLLAAGTRTGAVWAGLLWLVSVFLALVSCARLLGLKRRLGHSPAQSPSLP